VKRPFSKEKRRATGRKDKEGEGQKEKKGREKKKGFGPVGRSAWGGEEKEEGEKGFPYR